MTQRKINAIKRNLDAWKNYPNTFAAMIDSCKLMPETMTANEMADCAVLIYRKIQKEYV